MALENELLHLRGMVLKMCEQILENLKISIEVYHKWDLKKAELINDDVVDLYERLIEESCLNIMLKERPYASDLREVSGILKLVSDLERLGDHAEDLEEFASKLKDVKHYPVKYLEDAISKAMDMVDKSVLAFVNKDIELANKVIKDDDTVDELYDSCIKELINGTKNNEYPSDFAIYTTLVVKYIERIADHAVNVAEWVVYIQSGFRKDKQIF